MNINMLPIDEQEAATLNTPHAAEKVYAPDTTQRPYPRARCCARCRRGETGHNMPCGYSYSCPNPACDHGKKQP